MPKVTKKRFRLLSRASSCVALSSKIGKFLSAACQDFKIIDPAIYRERLDSAILAGVGLISDKVSLDKKEIRTRTGLLYVDCFLSCCCQCS